MSNLADACDLHLHTAPDQRDRWYDDIEAARLADQHGMYAVVLKSHWTTTVDRAITAARAANVSTVRVYGGLVLNESVGGLNPDAVDKSLALGAKVVWMPTHDAAYHRRQHGKSGGIEITDPATPSGLKRIVERIVDMCADASTIVATGHLAAREIALLASFARPRGAQVLVTHPEWIPTVITLDEQRELLGLGVMFERVCVAVTDGATEWRLPVGEIAHQIREIGPRATVLSSDLGTKLGPRPFEGFIDFYDALMAEGISHDDIMLMSRENPRRLLEH